MMKNTFATFLVKKVVTQFLTEDFFDFYVSLMLENFEDIIQNEFSNRFISSLFNDQLRPLLKSHQKKQLYNCFLTQLQNLMGNKYVLVCLEKMTRTSSSNDLCLNWLRSLSRACQNFYSTKQGYFC